MMKINILLCLFAAFAFAKEQVKFVTPEANQVVSVYQEYATKAIPFELTNNENIDYGKTYIALYRYRWYWSSLIKTRPLTADMTSLKVSKDLKPGKYFLKVYKKGIFKKKTIAKSPIFTIETLTEDDVPNYYQEIFKDKKYKKSKATIEPIQEIQDPIVPVKSKKQEKYEKRIAAAEEKEKIQPKKSLHEIMFDEPKPKKKYFNDKTYDKF